MGDRFELRIRGRSGDDLLAEFEESLVLTTDYSDGECARLDHDGVRLLRAVCDRFLETVEERGPGRISGVPSDGKPVRLEEVMTKFDFVELTTQLGADPQSDVASQDVEDDLALRRLLWLAHGCQGLYGDDGELQCGACMVDFKRDSVAEIERVLRERGLRKLAEVVPDGYVTAAEHKGLPALAGQAGGCQHASCRAHLKIATDALDRMRQDHGGVQIAIAVPPRPGAAPNRCQNIGTGPYRCELEAGHEGSCKAQV
jgi:hypothetical protein